MMRHDATSVILASQEPMRIDPLLIELASVLVCNKIIFATLEEPSRECDPCLRRETG
ncbi:MAG: hypothetical protein QM757_44030 [Paludibaculum sp.]